MPFCYNVICLYDLDSITCFCIMPFCYSVIYFYDLDSVTYFCNTVVYVRVDYLIFPVNKWGGLRRLLFFVTSHHYGLDFSLPDLNSLVHLRVYRRRVCGTEFLPRKGATMK